DGIRDDLVTGFRRVLFRSFYDRKRTNAFGKFFTRDMIAAVKAQHVSELLRTMPGVALSLSRNGGYRVRMRSCAQAPLVWIDGVRSEERRVGKAGGALWTGR